MNATDYEVAAKNADELKLLQRVNLGDEFENMGVTWRVAELRTKPFPSVKLVRGAHSVIKFPSVVLSWTRFVPKPTAQEAHERALRKFVDKLSEAYDHAVATGADQRHIESLREQLRLAKVNLYDVAVSGNVPNPMPPRLRLHAEDRKRLEAQAAEDEASRERMIAARQSTRDSVFEWLERMVPGGGTIDQTEVQRNVPGTMGWQITGGYLIPYEDMMRLMERVSEALEERD